MSRRDVDRRVLELARNQHGAFNWDQAKAVGASGGMATRRVSAGTWQRAAPGVYLLTATPQTWLRRLKAAELSLPGAAVWGRSALQLMGLPGGVEGRPRLTVRPGSHHSSLLAVVRQASPVTITRLHGFRVVTVEQAICDAAAFMTMAELERLIDHALLERRTTVHRLADRFTALAGSRLPGVANLRTLLDERGEGFTVPESELERRLYRVLAEAGVPDVVRQASPPWAPASRRRFDGLCMEWRLIFEADGRRWHARMEAFERDRQRDLEAAGHGYSTLRLTWAQLTAGRQEVIQALRASRRWGEAA